MPNFFLETKNLLEHSNLFYIITANMSGRYSYVNTKYKKVFENDFGELVGQPYAITMHPDDTAICKSVAEKCFRNPEKVFPATIRKHDGKGGYIFTQWEYKAMFKDNGEPEGIFCLGYDITEFQNKNKQLLNALETVDHQQFILKSIAYHQSHNIRRPLANILGLGLVLEHMEIDPNVKNVINLVIQSANELDDAIKQVIDDSTIDEG